MITNLTNHPGKFAIAIALSTAIAMIGLPNSVALADADEQTAQAGPILSVDQVILLVRAIQPYGEVDELKIENDEDRGLVYRIKLTDRTRIYMDAQTGEILEIDD